MANLVHFIGQGARSGLPVTVYLGRAIPVGGGRYVRVSPLHLGVFVEAKVFGIGFKGTIDIRMPDESPAGVCTVEIRPEGGGPQTFQSKYHTEGRVLVMDIGGHTVRLEDNDRQWTWITAQGSSIGFWPESDEKLPFDGGADYSHLQGPAGSRHGAA